MLKATRRMIGCEVFSKKTLARVDDMYDTEFDLADESFAIARRNLLEAQMLTADIFTAFDHIGINQVFKGTISEVPKSVDLPTLESIEKKEKAARKREEEG